MPPTWRISRPTTSPRSTASGPSWSQRRASAALINQGVGDLYRIYAIAQRDDIDFNLTFIPPSFNVVKTEDFDMKYMQALFTTGDKLGAEGVHWFKHPPVLVSGVDGESPTDAQFP